MAQQAPLAAPPIAPGSGGGTPGPTVDTLFCFFNDFDHFNLRLIIFAHRLTSLGFMYAVNDAHSPPHRDW